LRLEGGVLPQDRPLELLQRGSRLDPELVDEHPSGPLVGLERLLLASGAIEREDLLLSQPLPVRLLADQLLELGQEHVVGAQLEAGVVPELDGPQPELLEALRRDAGGRLVCDVGERRAAPE